MKQRKPLPRATKPMKRTPLPRPTKTIPKRKYRPQRVVGKLGIVRLRGKALKELRRRVFERDRFLCVDCGCVVAWDWKDAVELGLPVGELSHHRNKRMYGDTEENTCCRCRPCHRDSHNAGGKPVPAKEKPDATIPSGL